MRIVAFSFCPRYDEFRIEESGMPIRAYYNATVSSFLKEDSERILGVLAAQHHHALEEQQRWAWLQQLSILKPSLANQADGRIFLEFYIPRMGKRADAVLVTANIVFVIEFKVGASGHASIALEQVEDYALDLKNFHEGSHAAPIVPVLVSTSAESGPFPDLKFANDLVASPLGTNKTDLGGLIGRYLRCASFSKARHRPVDGQRLQADAYYRSSGGNTLSYAQRDRHFTIGRWCEEPPRD